MQLAAAKQLYSLEWSAAFNITWLSRITQYRARARAREHNKMQKLILNYTRPHEHTHLIHGHEHGYVRIYAYLY